MASTSAAVSPPDCALFKAETVVLPKVRGEYQWSLRTKGTMVARPAARLFRRMTRSCPAGVLGVRLTAENGTERGRRAWIK